MTGPVVEFDRVRVLNLLDRLDERLKVRGIGGSIYVVGGVAIALTVSDGRRTADVDALVSNSLVIEEAQLLAAEEGISPTWLNESVRPYVPPRPEEALIEQRTPGLAVHIAPARHLLAMKLVALRQRDLPDIVALVGKLGLRNEPSEAFARLLFDAYGSVETLAIALGVPDDTVVEEAESIGRWLVEELAHGAAVIGRRDRQNAWCVPKVRRQ